MASMESVKVGKKLLIDGVPYEVMKSEHLKVAMGKGMEKTSLKNLLTGNVVQKTFREVDKIEMADIASSSAEFLYSDDTDYHFMNTETYDQFSLNNAAIGDNKLYLCEGDKVIVQIFNNRPINVNLEATVTLPVVETPPGEKGDTATGGKKPATLLTGLVVQVPLFIKVGDRLRVDTRTGEYLSRVQ
ncbi:MAG: elongation factor P [Candidatus Gracilibacteria bacterium]|nr:elongation factor P [Candidatus Gracilibacteria bacterium]